MTNISSPFLIHQNKNCKMLEQLNFDNFYISKSVAIQIFDYLLKINKKLNDILNFIIIYADVAELNCQDPELLNKQLLDDLIWIYFCLKKSIY
jgi:hypothetical protein